MQPIRRAAADPFVRRHHYSGKVVPNSQVHFGVFLPGDARLHGVMQFGPPLKKDLLIGLVEGTRWNGFLELNRLVFDEALPRNSESRAIGVALRLLRRGYPHLEWVVSFADGTQCGDGTIYRAAGFMLTGIKRNYGLRRNPETGEVIQSMQAHHLKLGRSFRTDWEALDGFMLRYLSFLNPEARSRLTVPVSPFSAIQAKGAGMYRGQPRSRAGSVDSGTSGNPAGKGRCKSDPRAPRASETPPEPR